MSNTKPALERKLSLLHATAINMIDMVGIGPFVVLSVVAQIMGGPYFLYAWVAGALLSYLDAMVWSQLGAALSLKTLGGSYSLGGYTGFEFGVTIIFIVLDVIEGSVGKI